MFFGVKFEGTFKTNPIAKEDFTKDIERLLYSPDIYIDGYNYTNPTEEHKQLVNRIKSMGIDLIMNNFLTNGFNITHYTTNASMSLFDIFCICDHAWMFTPRLMDIGFGF